jgi:hypothetical protein
LVDFGNLEERVMVKFAAIALSSVLGIAGMASAAPAAADSFVSASVPMAYGPGPYVHARDPFYWHRDFYRHDLYRDHFRYHGYYRR